MKKKGVDILPHRMRMVNEDLDKKFKDPDDPFRIVFVCAMWMTGFDVPSCSTIYLDKPMRNHTLMQTIARANRVFKDKTNGLIVDYVGVFRSLEKALAIYGEPGDPGDLPIKDKEELLEEIKKAVEDVKGFLKSLEIDLEVIRQEEDVFKRVALKDEAVNKILKSEDLKKDYLSRADLVKKLFRAYLPDSVGEELAEIIFLIRRIAKTIRSIIGKPEIDEVMAKIDALLDHSVIGFKIEDKKDKFKVYDLSKIDFDALKQKFERGKKRIELERLKNSIESKLILMILKNRSRIDFQMKLKEMIDMYNTGDIAVEEMFKKLLEFAKKLNVEEKRFMREGLQNEEELAIFDLLTKPDMKLTQKEIREVKKISHSLLDNLKTQKLVLDWKQKQQTRAGVKLAIAELLGQLPPVFTDFYDEKCDAVYQFVYDMELGKESTLNSFVDH